MLNLSEGGWRIAAGGLLLATLLLYLLNLGAVPLFDGDEPRYAQAAREMSERGDWLTPTFNGELRFQKPILFYWCLRLSYGAFGIGEASGRIWAGLATILTVLLVLWFCARRLGRLPALVAASAVAFNAQAIVVGRAVTPDALLCLLLTSSLLSFYEAYTREDGRSTRLYLLAWVLAALATLTKGPIGIGIPLLVAGLFALSERRLPVLLREGRPLLGLLLFTLIAGPWFLAMTMMYGRTFTGFFFGQEHLERFTHTMEEHSGPFFYYPLAVAGLFYPWSGLVPVGAWLAARFRTLAPAPDPEIRLGRFALIWVALVFFVFTLSRTKLPHYVYPAYPALAILTALCWSRVVSGALSTRLVRANFLLAALPVAGVVTVAAVGLALPQLTAKLDVPNDLRYKVLGMLLFSAFWVALGLWELKRQQPDRSRFALAAGAMVLCFGLALGVAPPVHELFCGGLVRLSRRAGQLAPAGRFAVWRGEHSATVFYFGHPGVQTVREHRQLRAWEHEGKDTLLVTRTRHAEELQRHADLVADDHGFSLFRLRKRM